jgi:hypothetical protein
LTTDPTLSSVDHLYLDKRRHSLKKVQNGAVAVQIIGMPCVGPPLGGPSPVAPLHGDTSHDDCVRAKEFCRDIFFDWWRWDIANVHPDDAGALFDWVGLDPSSPAGG